MRGRRVSWAGLVAAMLAMGALPAVCEGAQGATIGTWPANGVPMAVSPPSGGSLTGAAEGPSGGSGAGIAKGGAAAGTGAGRPGHRDTGRAGPAQAASAQAAQRQPGASRSRPRDRIGAGEGARGARQSPNPVQAPVADGLAAGDPLAWVPIYGDPFGGAPLREPWEPRPELDPPVEPVVVSWYARRFRMSRREARRHLRVEERGMRMIVYEAEALGRGYGGVWFDNREGAYHVGVAPGGSTQAAARVARAMGIGRETVLLCVRWSMAEIERANGIVARKLNRMEYEREAGVGAMSSANAVEITLSRTGTRRNRELAERVARRAPVKTVIMERGRPPKHHHHQEARPRGADRASSRGAQGAHHLACERHADGLNDYPDTFCGRPLRSAAGMDDDVSGTECSVGGVAYREPSTYVVTAGHCLEGELGHRWSSVDAITGQRQQIGTAEWDVDGNHGDFGLIREQGGFWEGIGTTYADVTDEARVFALDGVAESFNGMFQCWSGAQSNIHHHLACGTVVATNVSEAGTYHLDEAYGPPDPQGHGLCLYDGDSGGPVITSRYLVGLVSAGSNCGEGEFTATYAPAPWIERYTGVHFEYGIF